MNVPDSAPERQRPALPFGWTPAAGDVIETVLMRLAAIEEAMGSPSTPQGLRDYGATRGVDIVTLELLTRGALHPADGARILLDSMVLLGGALGRAESQALSWGLDWLHVGQWCRDCVTRSRPRVTQEAPLGACVHDLLNALAEGSDTSAAIVGAVQSFAERVDSETLDRLPIEVLMTRERTS